MARSIELAPGLSFTPDELALHFTRQELASALGLTRAWRCFAAEHFWVACTPDDHEPVEVHRDCGWQLYVMEGAL